MDILWVLLFFFVLVSPVIVIVLIVQNRKQAKEKRLLIEQYNSLNRNEVKSDVNSSQGENEESGSHEGEIKVTELTDGEIKFFNEYEFRDAKGEIKDREELELQLLGYGAKEMIMDIKFEVRYAVENNKPISFSNLSFWILRSGMRGQEIKKRLSEVGINQYGVPDYKKAYAFIQELEDIIYKYEKIYTIEHYPKIKTQVELIREAREAEEKLRELKKVEERISRREHISQKVKDMVWNRDGGKCVECGSSEKLEFDHIVPFSKGGSNTYRNIQLLCEPCNRKKSNKIG
ncbi:HNH endonuclease [Riemerella anatipestifer]|uniref:HNH endonuclease n=1 Tax=Riemerella anatipestifer TaxID=34085 RepID=UPI001C881753|nr:HNH endonuclease [Riemerella anatipestifer]